MIAATIKEKNMPIFPQLPQEKYQNIRNQIRNGDVMLCSGSCMDVPRFMQGMVKAAMVWLL